MKIVLIEDEPLAMDQLLAQIKSWNGSFRALYFITLEKKNRDILRRFVRRSKRDLEIGKQKHLCPSDEKREK